MAAEQQRPFPWRSLWAGCLLLAAGGVPAASLDPDPEVHVQRSASGRFSVYGQDPVWNLQWLIAADSAASRLERFFGKPLPHEPGFPLRIVVDDSPMESPAIASQAVLTGGVLDQRIFIRHPDRLEPGAMEDQFVACVLARYVSYPRPVSTVRMPAWFVAGLSGFCRVSDRANLYKTMRDAWAGGTLPPLVRVLSWETSVPREEPARRACAALILWAHAQPEAEALASRLLVAFQEGKTGFPALRAAWPEIGVTERDAEMQWNLWIASLGGRLPGPIQSQVESAGALLERLGVSREIAGAEQRPDLPERVTPALLLAHREEDWVAPAAIRMARSLSYLQVMELPPALRELRNGYLRWLTLLALPDSRGMRAGDRALKRELDRLDSELRTYLEWTLDRKTFLDGIEAERETVRLREEAERRETLRSGITGFLDQMESTVFFSIGEEKPGR